MPTAAIRSAVFLQQQGTINVDSATSNPGYTALQETRTETFAGDISTREISSPSHLTPENVAQNGCLSSHINPAPDQLAQIIPGKKLSLQPGFPPMVGNINSGHPELLAVVEISLNSGQECTAGPCLQHETSKKNHWQASGQLHW